MVSLMEYHSLERAAAVDRGNAQLLIEELMSKVYDLQNVQPAVEKEEKNDDIGFFMDLFEWDKKN